MVIMEVVLGGVLRLTGHKTSGLHVLYGVLPLLVAILSEQLRAATAQVYLDSRGVAAGGAALAGHGDPAARDRGDGAVGGRRRGAAGQSGRNRGVGLWTGA